MDNGIIISYGIRYIKFISYEADTLMNRFEIKEIKIIINKGYSYRIVNKELKLFIEQYNVKFKRIIIILPKTTTNIIDYTTNENWEDKKLINNTQLSILKENNTEKGAQFKVSFDKENDVDNIIDVCRYTYFGAQNDFRELLKGVNYQYLNIYDGKHILMNSFNLEGNNIIIDTGHKGMDILAVRDKFLLNNEYLEIAGTKLMEELSSIINTNEETELYERRKKLNLSDMQGSNKQFYSNISISLSKIVKSNKLENFNLFVTGGLADLTFEELMCSEGCNRRKLPDIDSISNYKEIPEELIPFIYTCLQSIPYCYNNYMAIDINDESMNKIGKMLPKIKTVTKIACMLTLSISISSIYADMSVTKELESLKSSSLNYNSEKLNSISEQVESVKSELDNILYKDKENNSLFKVSNLIYNIESIKPETNMLNKIEYKNGKFYLSISSLDTKDLKYFHDKLLTTKVFTDIETINNGIEDVKGILSQNITMVAK